MSKQQDKREHSKMSILKAAEIEFSQKGLYGARVDIIAAESGVNKALIYRYFDSKEGLYKEVLNMVYQRLGELEDVVIATSGNEISKLKAFVRVYFKFLLDNPSFVRLVMWENLNDAKYFKEKGIGSIKDPILSELGRIVDECKKRQHIPASVDGDQLILTLIACSFNYFSNMSTLSGIVHKDLMDSSYIEKRIQATTDMLLSYMESKNE